MAFAVVGVINTIVDFAILNILLFIGPLKAKIVATVIATTGSYLMNRYWTYARRERTSPRREYVLFFVLNLIGLAIQLAVLGLAKYGLGYSEDGSMADRIAFNIANIFGTGLGMVFRFWSYRTFVFKASAPVEPVPVEPAPVELVPVAVEMAAPSQRTAGQPKAVEDEFAELTATLEAELDPVQTPLNT